MFRDLQKGYSVGILDKSNGDIKYGTGTVVSVSAPRYDANKQFVKGTLPQMVVDITIEHEGKTLTYVVPETGSIACTPQLTLACDTALLSNEVQSLLRQSEEAVASVDRHKANIEECKKILATLSPSYASNKEQNRRLDTLEESMAGMRSDLSKILERLSAGQSPKTK